ncbi:CoA-transferase family III, partial [Aureobasidium melanogenum]
MANNASAASPADRLAGLAHSEQHYFNSYNHHGIHEEMLKDDVRTRSYRDAIYQNRHLFKDKVVLDVGCGTSILSMFAAKAGAKHVIGVDMSTIIDKAKEIVEVNGLSDKITLLQGKMEEVTLPFPEVDIIISEWMGYFLLYESMLDTVLWARDRYLKKGGLIFPDKATIFVAGIEDGDYKEEKINFWDNVWGFDYTPLKRTALTEPLVDTVDLKAVVTDPAPLITLDLYTCKVADLAFHLPYSLPIRRTDYVHALIAWFDIEFSACHKPVKFSTGPHTKYTHWKQTVFYLDDNLTVEAGEKLNGTLLCKPNERNRRDLDVEIEYNLEANEQGREAKGKCTYVIGDDTRAWGPPYAPHTNGSPSNSPTPGESAYFLSVNRNKKSLALSFQSPSGVEILHKLASECDVLVENYLPGALKKYKMDYETLKKVNPKLIYASITGYGQTGPYSDRAGYDVMVEAEMGLMHITGHRDGPPAKVGVAVTDLTTGLYTSNSILASLLQRSITGQGQWIDVSLSDCQVATLSNLASSHLISGKPDSGRWGTAHPSIVPYKGFETADGSVMIGGGNDRLFGVMCDKLGKSEWKQDPKFVTNAQRVANRDLLEELITTITKTKTTQQWLEVFEGSGMPYAAVNDIAGTMRHEHVLARDMVKEVDHPACGPIKLVNTPVKFSESTPGIRTPPPTLGQHTSEVLLQLGYSEAEVEEFKTKGVVS